MKPINDLKLLLLVPLFLLCGCSDDDQSFSDVDGQNPIITLITDKIQTEPGREFLIKAKIEDKDGISSIHLQNATLELDKVIDLTTIYDDLQFTYDLNYKFKTKKDFEGDNIDLKIIVTDVGQRVTEEVIKVTMDGDFMSPVFTVSPDASMIILIRDQTNLNLKFTAEDDKALDYVTISIPEINYERRIDAEGKVIDYNETLPLPSEAATYTLTLKAIDKFAHEVSKTSIITVSEMPDFQKMYLADVATVAELNSDVFGVPMRIDRIGEYKYKANYYNQKAGTEIFFIPQKSDFSPICFGLDPDDNTKLTDDPNISKPIVLTEANVYYEITLDLKAASYSIKTYSIAEAIDPIPHKFGSISLDTWADGGSWLQEFYFGIMTASPKDIQRFKQDATNPHIFYTEQKMSLTAGEQMKFTFHNWHSDGWWNYCTWRVDNSEDPDTFDYYGTIVNPKWAKPNTTLDNWAKPTVKQTGSYKLYFDAHLGRAKLVRE